MSEFDPSNFRAFRLHTIVQNIGTELYLKYLDRRAKEKSFASLRALLEDPVEKPKLLQAYKKEIVYSPYDKSGNLKSDFPESADIIKLCKLHKYCDVLKKDSVPSQFDAWWEGWNGQVVFDTVLKSKRRLRDQPGAACLVLYHVRNRFLPGAHNVEFSLNQELYDMAVDIAIPALEVLGDSLDMGEQVESRIAKAKRDAIDENLCREVDMRYKQETAGMRSDRDIIKAVFKRNQLQEMWREDMDNDNILSRMVTFDFITFHDDVPKIKSNPARSDRNLALWNMLADRIQIRDRFKQLCDIIKEQKQSSIANALLTAWLEESGGIAL